MQIAGSLVVIGFVIHYAKRLLRYFQRLLQEITDVFTQFFASTLRVTGT